MTENKKLNLGCGTDIREGWVNSDKVMLDGVDIVCDIEKEFPFESETFDYVLANDLLEHVTEWPESLREIHRILKVGGIVEIRVPHFTSPNNFIDPTHRRMFSAFSFDVFTKNTIFRGERPYYYNFAFSEIIEKRITFEKFYSPFFVRLFGLVNRHPSLQRHYENMFFSSIIKAENIVVKLRK